MQQLQLPLGTANLPICPSACFLVCAAVASPCLALPPIDLPATKPWF